MKTCTKCGEEKSLDGFHRRKDSRDGHAHQCKACAIARSRAWVQANPERAAEYQARYTRERPEKRRAAYRAWLERNPGRDRIHSNAWNARNPKKVRAWVDRRRARLVDAYVADVDHDAIILRDEGHCGICGDPIMGPLHIDHVIPLAAGGTHEPDNVQCAHASCNLRKWTKTAEAD